MNEECFVYETTHSAVYETDCVRNDLYPVTSMEGANGIFGILKSRFWFFTLPDQIFWMAEWRNLIEQQDGNKVRGFAGPRKIVTKLY